jgi:hypothetical protein
MTALLDGVTVNTTSADVVAIGPIVVSTTGMSKMGMVIIEADIGGGYAVAYTHSPGASTSLARLELPPGAVYRARLTNINPGDSVSVHYVPA